MSPDVDPGQFSETAKEAVKEKGKEAVKDAAKEEAETRTGNILSKINLDPVSIIGRLASTDDGMTVDQVKDAYGCSDGFAYTVRGTTRMFGLDDVPAGADILVGIIKMSRGGEDESET